MNKVERRKIKRATDLKLIIFTFLGAFILFFAAFTYFLPMIAPKVEIPALSEDYAMDSITSQDFRGRIDPRLRSIEQQEDAPPEAAQNANTSVETTVPAESSNEPDDNASDEDNETSDSANQNTTTTSPVNNATPKEPSDNTPVSSIRVPPRPMPLDMRDKVNYAAPNPVYNVKVVVGDFSNPKEAKIASDILTSLNYNPIIREVSGKYMLQVGSYSETTKAQNVVNDLKNRNFDAKIIYE